MNKTDEELALMNAASLDELLDMIENSSSESLDDWKGQDHQYFSKVWDLLEELDPWNDRFHVLCRHWPNCEEMGCMPLEDHQ